MQRSHTTGSYLGSLAFTISLATPIGYCIKKRDDKAPRPMGAAVPALREPFPPYA